MVSHGELAHISAQGRLRHSWDMESIAGVDDDLLTGATGSGSTGTQASRMAARNGTGSIDLILLPRASHPKRRGQIERRIYRVRLTFPDSATALQAATAIRHAATPPRGGSAPAAPTERPFSLPTTVTAAASAGGTVTGVAAAGAHGYNHVDSAAGPPRVNRRIFAVLNPHGGGGTAAVLFEQRVAPLLRWAGLEVELHRTQHAGHAVEFGQRYDPSRYDGVLFCTGDGGVQEFVSGLLTRPDWRLLVRRVPIAPIAGGTGESLRVSQQL